MMTIMMIMRTMTTKMMILWKLSIAGKERRRVSKVHPPSSKSCAPADINININSNININININIVFDIVIIGGGNL